MTVIQRLELLAEDVKRLEGEGGGGDLSAYLTKDEASSTYETQSAASSALALKADVATTYTKSEVDSAIAAVAGDGVPAYVNLPTGANPYFPEDKTEILEKHLPFTTQNPPTSTSTVYIFIGTYGTSYVYKMFGQNGYIFELLINSTTRQITSTSKGGGGVIYDVDSANYMKYALSKPNDTLSGESNISSQVLTISGTANLNNSPYVYPKFIYCSSDASTTNLVNCPTNKAFYMFSDNYAGKPSQTIFEYDNPSIFYRRTRIDTNTWTDWYKFTSETSVSDSSYASTTAIPTDATNVACDVPYSHITKHNDFTLLKSVNSYTYAVRFTYSQSTTSNTCFYKGSFVNPSSNTLETYVVEIGPDNDLENTLVCLIGKYEVNRTT